jgi:2-dehydro-3-deoxyphosphogluconate aldolase/(4S)-4-hydroxy-2-oxoglutarate aldolase
LRGSRADRLVAGALVLVEEGVQALEFPLTSPGALEAISEAAGALDGHAMVGAGTVRNVDEARRAIDAGARFLVTPSLSVPVIEHALAHDTAALPGSFTPTEMTVATDAGAELVKLFPAASHRPEFVRQLRVPLPHIGVVPTGGIALETASEWLAAGAVALGVGTPLTGESLETGDFAGLRTRARAWRATCRDR